MIIPTCSGLPKIGTHIIILDTISKDEEFIWEFMLLLVIRTYNIYPILLKINKQRYGMKVISRIKNCSNANQTPYV